MLLPMAMSSSQEGQTLSKRLVLPKQHFPHKLHCPRMYSWFWSIQLPTCLKHQRVFQELNVCVGGYPKAGSIPKACPVFTSQILLGWSLVQPCGASPPAGEILASTEWDQHCPQDLLAPNPPPAVATSMFPLAESQIPCPQQHIQLRRPPPAHFPWDTSGCFCLVQGAPLSPASPQAAPPFPHIYRWLPTSRQQQQQHSSWLRWRQVFPKEPAPEFLKCHFHFADTAGIVICLLSVTKRSYSVSLCHNFLTKNCYIKKKKKLFSLVKQTNPYVLAAAPCLYWVGVSSSSSSLLET